MRCASQELDQALTKDIEAFSSSLCQQSPRCRVGRVSVGTGCKVQSAMYVIFQLTLEFYEKKARWLLPAEITNWEVWHLQLFIFDPASEEGTCVTHGSGCGYVLHCYRMAEAPAAVSGPAEREGEGKAGVCHG